MIAEKLARRVQPAGAAPSTVAGLKIDLDPDTLALADGSAIASWVDSASALNFVQATAGLKPTLKSGLANGHKIVRFDNVAGSQMAVTPATVMQVTSRTMFAVLKSNVADYTANGAILGMSGNNWYFGISNAESSLSVYNNAAAAVTPTAGLGSPGPFSNTARYHVLTAIVSTSGSNVRTILRLNGALKQDRTLATGHQAVTGTTMRAGNTAGTPLGADVARILAYNTALAMSDVVNIERWLAARFATRYG